MRTVQCTAMSQTTCAAQLQAALACSSTSSWQGPGVARLAERPGSLPALLLVTATWCT